MIDYEALEEMDYLPTTGKTDRKGNIVTGKEVKGRPVGSHTRFLARESNRHNRTHKEKQDG